MLLKDACRINPSLVISVYVVSAAPGPRTGDAGRTPISATTPAWSSESSHGPGIKLSMFGADGGQLSRGLDLKIDLVT
jgi:hypothetical protein